MSLTFSDELLAHACTLHPFCADDAPVHEAFAALHSFPSFPSRSDAESRTAQQGRPEPPDSGVPFQ